MTDETRPIDAAIRNSQHHRDKVLVREYVNSIEKLVEILCSISRSLVPVMEREVQTLREMSPNRVIFESYYLAGDEQVKTLPRTVLTALHSINNAYKKMYDYSK